MLKRAIVVPLALATLMWGAREQSTISAAVSLPLIESTEPDDICLMPPSREQTAAYQASLAAYTSRQRAGAATRQAGEGSPPGWPGKGVIGGNVPPTAAILDPWPTFDGMAVDGDNGVVVMSDENRHSVLIYDRAAGGDSTKTT